MTLLESKIQNWEFPTIDLIETGKRITALRIQSGYSVREIAEIFGFTSAQAVYNWQKGKTLPTMDNILVLSRLFKVSMEEILVVNEPIGHVSEPVCFRVVS